MFRSRMAMLAITTIATLFCSALIVTAQSSPEEKRTDVEQLKPNVPALPKPEIPKVEIPGVSTEKQKETEETELDERPTFDFSLPGDNRTQSLALFFERPFKFSNIEGKLSGNYFTTFTKEEIPPEESVWRALQKSFTGWEFLSRSYAYRLEGSTTGKWGVGGHIEFESDITIEKDPRLNFTFYGEYNPLSFVELAFGGWAEILRLGKEPLEGEKFRFGFRTHCNIEKEFKWVNLSMLIEYLPDWNFKSYRLNASPEIEFKLDNIKIPRKKEPFSFSIVLMGEIDYYSENDEFTVEPLFEMNPWEIRWTQLVRHRF